MFGKRRSQDALQGGTAAACGLHSWMKGWRQPGKRDGKLGWGVDLAAKIWMAQDVPGQEEQ